MFGWRCKGNTESIQEIRLLKVRPLYKQVLASTKVELLGCLKLFDIQPKSSDDSLWLHLSSVKLDSEITYSVIYQRVENLEGFDVF